MRKSTTILFIFLGSQLVLGQSTNISTLFVNDLRKGDLFYNVMAYANALELYLHYSSRHPSSLKVKERIADCYMRLGKFEDAEAWMRRIVTDSAATSAHYYRLGQVLLINEKYDEAKNVFIRFQAFNEDQRLAQSKLEFLRHFDYHLRDSNLYTIKNEWFNSEQSDFSAVYYDTGIVFVSARDRDLFIKKRSLAATNEDESLLNAFEVNRDLDPARSELDQVKLFYSKDLNSDYHDGPIAFFSNGTRIAFTRNVLVGGKPMRDPNGKVHLEIYFASLNANRKLTHVEAFPFNSQRYSVAHPWVSNDGATLFFTSDKPGGFGGTDIYKSERVDGKWSEPVNLGGEINTAGDEGYPFIQNDSILFFASNGHGGFGALDNFWSKVGKAGFGPPVNMSYPINTSKDDFALTIHPEGKMGLLSSNRGGGKGYDDVYSFTMNSFTLLGSVVEHTSRALIPDATIRVFDHSGKTITSQTTSKDGVFFSNLPLNQKFWVIASKNGYTSIDTLVLDTHSSVIIDTIAIGLWENGLFAKGTIYSNETQERLGGTIVTLDNLTTGQLDSVTIGKDGTYNFLVLPNQRYRISAAKHGYISQGFNLNTSNLYRGVLLNDFLLEEVFLEKLELLFDFNKSEIREEFSAALTKIVKDLKRRPESTVHIAAHADATGTREYNLTLSNKRAKATVDYLVANGIAKSRIEAIGFGEELILNRCSDGVECTDEEHSLNRRAEVKVQIPEEK